MSLIYLKSNLKLIWYGIYIKEIKSFFGDNQNILLNKTQLQMGKEISNEKKRLILDVYNMFGKLSDLKIRELIFSEDSPINLIYRIPEVLYTYIYYSINIPKNVTKQWFEDKFLQNN